MAARFRILVVDDSELSREALKGALQSDPALEVVGMAGSGEESLELAERLRPDLITMDLQMPGMGGLKAIERHMRARPTPIVVISERSSTVGIDLNYEALSRGALELIPKSSLFGTTHDGMRYFAERLRLLVEGSLAPAQPPPHFSPDSVPLSAARPLLVGIGASTGGPRALTKLLGGLPSDFPVPVVLVQHMAEDFFDSFVRFLSDSTPLAVVLAQADMTLRAGTVYVAPPRQELFIKESLRVKLAAAPREATISPTVDSLFFSMASALKDRCVAVLLTGMGDDGAQGLLKLRRVGARTVAQDRASCAVYGMPRAAAELGAVESVVALDDVARVLVRLTRQREAPAGETRGARKRVLVIDDDPRMLGVSQRHLEQAGYEVVTLDNPFLVAGTLRRLPADLLVLESELTTTRGAVVTRALREHTGMKVPVLLYSSLDAALLKGRAVECEAVAVACKSANGAELLEQVELLLGGPNRSG